MAQQDLPPRDLFAYGRRYRVVICSGSDKTWWELDDIGPPQGGGTVLIAEHDDDSRQILVWLSAAGVEIPFEVVEGFCRYVRAYAENLGRVLDDMDG